MADTTPVAVTPQMSFEMARTLIKNGDAINIYRPEKWSLKSLIYGPITFMSGSPIYHVVVAMWMRTPNDTPRLMCVEANLLGGKRIVPLSIYMTRKMEVMPWPAQYSFTAMEEALVARVAEESYGLLDFITIGLREFLGIKRKAAHIAKGEVCSELVSNAWIAGGFPFDDSIVSPGKLKGEMMKYGVQPSIVIPPASVKVV